MLLLISTDGLTECEGDEEHKLDTEDEDFLPAGSTDGLTEGVEVWLENLHDWTLDLRHCRHQFLNFLDVVLWLVLTGCQQGLHHLLHCLHDRLPKVLALICPGSILDLVTAPLWGIAMEA